MRAGESGSAQTGCDTDRKDGSFKGEELDADKQAQTRLPSLLPNLIWSSVQGLPDQWRQSGEESDPVQNDKQYRVRKHKHVLSAVGQKTQGLCERKLLPGDVAPCATFRNFTK